MWNTLKMLKKVKKFALPLLLTTFSYASISADNVRDYNLKKIGQIYSIHHYNKDYRARFSVDYENKVANWQIVDKDGELIGDEEDEIKLYEELAFQFEMNKFMKDNYENIEEANSGFREVLYAQVLTQDLMQSVIEKGSNLEGKLSSMISMGNASLPVNIQKELVKETVIGYAKDIIYDFVFNGSDEELQNIDDVLSLASSLESRFKDTVHYKMIRAIGKLETAERISDNMKEVGDSEESLLREKYWENYTEGMKEGFACAALWSKLSEQNTFSNIAKDIGSNFAEGFTGLNIDEMIKDENMRKYIFSNKNMEEAFDAYEKEMVKWETVFNTIERKWDVDDEDSMGYRFVEELKAINKKVEEIKNKSKKTRSAITLDNKRNKKSDKKCSELTLDVKRSNRNTDIRFCPEVKYITKLMDKDLFWAVPTSRGGRCYAFEDKALKRAGFDMSRCSKSVKDSEEIISTILSMGKICINKYPELGEKPFNFILRVDCNEDINFKTDNINELNKKLEEVENYLR